MGYVFRGPEGLLIWCAKWGREEQEEARRLFPWWGKVRQVGREELEEFAPSWSPRPVPNFLFKEMNTGRVVGAIE